MARFANSQILSDEYLENAAQAKGIDCLLTSNFDEEYRRVYPKDISKKLPEIAAKYPINLNKEIRGKICSVFDLKNVALGCGAEDLIIRLNSIVQRGSKRAIFVVPIFYRIHETFCGAKAHVFEDSFSKRNFHKGEVVWMQNPNLFSGKIYMRQDIVTVAKQNPASIFLID